MKMYIAETEKSVKNIVVDDMILTTDMPTSAGSRMLDGYISLFEAQAVTNLKENGYTVCGKANTGEFNLDLLGETSYFGACEENGVTLMCAYPVRYWPGVVKLKELVDSGEYGKVIMMSVWTEQLTNKPGWQNTGRLGGGQFFSHGCHYVDLLLWFLGN